MKKLYAYQLTFIMDLDHPYIFFSETEFEADGRHIRKEEFDIIYSDTKLENKNKEVIE